VSLNYEQMSTNPFVYWYMKVKIKTIDWKGSLNVFIYVLSCCLWLFLQMPDSKF